MAGIKDYIILCLDTGPSMDTAPLDEGETRLETAVKISSRIVQQKMFAGSKDYVGLVLFGTGETRNELAEAGDGYQNITVAWSPAPPSLEFLKYITNEIQPGDTPGDFLDAVVVAMDVLVHAIASAKRVGQKKIYLITDVGSEYTDDGLDHIAAGLKEKEIELIIVGPDLDTEGGGGGGGGGEGGGGGGGGGGSGRGGSSGMIKKTAQQRAGEAVLSRLVTEVDGANFSFREAMQVANFIRKTGKRQTTRFAGHIEIGSQLKVACKIFTRVMHERPATWKKVSAVSQAQLAVLQQRTYHLNDEDETEVMPENIAKGYRYGRSLIPITDDDETQMKVTSDRCLSVLGFSPQSCVCLHQTIGSSVQVVIPTPHDECAGRAMSALIHALYETGTAGVARYVWRQNAAPRLVALLPQIKASHECLLMLHLPYMEDVRQYSFPSLPGPGRNTEPSEEQLSAVDSLITSMNLMTADRDENGEPCEVLQPKLTMNPLTQRVFQCITDRALHSSTEIPVIEPELAATLEPNPNLMAQCTPALTSVQELFSLTRLEKKKDSNAAAIWKESSDLCLDSEAPPTKKQRIEEDTDFSMASLARGKVTEVGTLDPVADFCRLIGRKDTDFEGDCQQLQQVLLDLVRGSFGDAQYRKSLECLRTLRRECLQRSKVDIFNDFLRKVKSDLIGTRYSAFWDYIVNEGVTLVTNSECTASSVTDSDARNFLFSSEDQLPPGDVSADADDADDLLAMM